MYSRQTSIFRLVLSFLLAFAIFSALGYAIYRWTPRRIKGWFHRQLGANRDKLSPRGDEDPYSSSEVSSSTLVRRPRRRGRIQGKVLYKRGLSDSDESEKRKRRMKRSSSQPGWKRLLKEFSDLAKRGGGRSSSSTSSSLTSSLFDSYPSRKSSHPKSRRAAINVIELHLGEYRNDDKKLERKVGIFHTRVRSLAARHGGEVAEEYLLNAHKFWDALKRREKHRARLAKSLGKELNAQETLLKKVSKEKVQLLKQLKRTTERLSRYKEQLIAKEQKLSALEKQLESLQKGLADVKGAQEVRLERLQLAVDQLTAARQAEPSSNEEIGGNERQDFEADADAANLGSEDEGLEGEELESSTDYPDDFTDGISTNLDDLEVDAPGDDEDSYEFLQSNVYDPKLRTLGEKSRHEIDAESKESSEEKSDASSNTADEISVQRDVSEESTDSRHGNSWSSRPKTKRAKSHHKGSQSSRKKSKRKGKSKKGTR